MCTKKGCSIVSGALQWRHVVSVAKPDLKVLLCVYIVLLKKCLLHFDKTYSTIGDHAMDSRRQQTATMEPAAWPLLSAVAKLLTVYRMSLLRTPDAVLGSMVIPFPANSSPLGLKATSLLSMTQYPSPLKLMTLPEG
jgi:hypothetical protein